MKKILERINNYLNEYNEICTKNPEIAQQIALASAGLNHY